jgi:hypothetical protein
VCQTGGAAAVIRLWAGIGGISHADALLVMLTLVIITKIYFSYNNQTGTGMNFSGNQLRAARALLGLDQDVFAELVGISVNTVRTMEACGAEAVGGFASTRNRVRESLEGAGIEFLNDGEPGVRLRKGRKGAGTTKPRPKAR